VRRHSAQRDSELPADSDASWRLVSPSKSDDDLRDIEAEFTRAGYVLDGARRSAHQAQPDAHRGARHPQGRSGA